MSRIDVNALGDFFVNTLWGEGQVVVEIGGECDGSTLERVNEALRGARAEPARDVIVDLKQASFVDSLTLGSLTAAAKQVRANGASFSVIGAEAPAVRRVFEVTGLDAYLFSGHVPPDQAKDRRP